MRLFQTDRKIFRVLILTFVLNLVVCIAKIVYGIITHSLSLEADGFHSLLDSSSNIVGMVGVYLAAKPPDSEHPYGHRKIEAFASMGISLLLFLTCYEIVSNGISRIQNPVVPDINFLSFIIMVVSMIINYFVSRYEHREGHHLKSDILLADAAHTRSDLLVSFSVIISFIAVLLNKPFVDILIAGGIVIFIFFMAFRILYNSMNILLDAQLLDTQKITRLVCEVDGIKECHQIRSHGTQRGIFLDLHIHVNPMLTTEESHALSHQVIQEIKTQYPNVVDVLIHTEPGYSKEQ